MSEIVKEVHMNPVEELRELSSYEGKYQELCDMIHRDLPGVSIVC